MLKTIYIVVPSLKSAGPVRVAIDLANALAKDKYVVKIVALSKPHFNADVNCRIETLKGLVEFVRSFISILPKTNNIIIHSHGLRPDLIAFFMKLLFLHRIKWISTIHN